VLSTLRSQLVNLHLQNVGFEEMYILKILRAWGEKIQVNSADPQHVECVFYCNHVILL